MSQEFIELRRGLRDALGLEYESNLATSNEDLVAAVEKIVRDVRCLRRELADKQEIADEIKAQHDRLVERLQGEGALRGELERAQQRISDLEAELAARTLDDVDRLIRDEQEWEGLMEDAGLSEPTGIRLALDEMRRRLINSRPIEDGDEP